MTVALVGNYGAWAATLVCLVAVIAVAGRVATLHSCGTVSALTVEVFLAGFAGTVVLPVVLYAGAPGWVQVAVGAAVLVGLPVLLGSREWRRARRDRESCRVSAERYAADAAAAAGFGGGR